MRRGKRFVSVILCAALTLGLLAGCRAEEEKEKVKLIIKTPPMFVDDKIEGNVPQLDFLKMVGEDFAAQYTDADVSIEVVQFEYVDETEFITDSFGTENATDVLMEGYFNMSSYIYGGNVVPLDDIISDELRADFYPAELAISQVEGRTYMLPFYSLQNTMCYNKNLFRECGLDRYIREDLQIQSWTLEEWEEILTTLAQKLPEMTYPMMMYGKNNQGDTHIMTLLRSRGGEFFDEEGYFHVNTPEGIEALQWILDGYAKGYFPSGCENIEISDCSTLNENNQLAISMTNNALLDSIADREGLVNFPSQDGNGLYTIFVTGFMVFDNGDEARLKAAKEFLRFLYSREEYLDYQREGLPANRSVVERSGDIIYNLDNYTANPGTSVNFTGNNPNWQGSETSVRSVFWPHIHALLSGDETPEECAKGIDEDCNQAIREGREKGSLHE